MTAIDLGFSMGGEPYRELPTFTGTRLIFFFLFLLRHAKNLKRKKVTARLTSMVTCLKALLPIPVCLRKKKKNMVKYVKWINMVMSKKREERKTKDHQSFMSIKHSNMYTTQGKVSQECWRREAQTWRLAAAHERGRGSCLESLARDNYWAGKFSASKLEVNSWSLSLGA